MVEKAYRCTCCLHALCIKNSLTRWLRKETKFWRRMCSSTNIQSCFGTWWFTSGSWNYLASSSTRTIAPSMRASRSPGSKSISPVKFLRAPAPASRTQEAASDQRPGSITTSFKSLTDKSKNRQHATQASQELSLESLLVLETWSNAPALRVPRASALMEHLRQARTSTQLAKQMSLWEPQLISLHLPTVWASRRAVP